MKNPSITAPSVSLPKGGGAMKGIGETFQPEAFSGVGTLSLPFTIPEARGFVPEINLQYSSGAGNSAFGIGFSLPLAAISRKTDNGIPQYNALDTFVLANTADLVPALVQNAQGEWIPDIRTVTEGTTTWRVTVFKPRTESAFNLIEQWEDINMGISFWRVVTAENTTHTYGKTENSRISNPDAPTQIFSWLIDYSVDANGNSIDYRYKEENNDNVPPTMYEQHRSVRANRYIERVSYGNITVDDGAGGTVEQYAFEVVFDYGGYDLANPDAPPSAWSVRSDPFSTYRAGFEIRTLRLCHNMLLFQRFPSEFDNQRFLVQALCLQYSEQPVMSCITGAHIVGYRKNSDDTYERKELPPLHFSYSEFAPYSGAFKPVVIDAGGALPGALDGGQFLPVDLYGEGMPGFVWSSNETTLYWRPQGDGVYGYPEPPVQFPIERNVTNGIYALTDVDGNGRMELVVNTVRRSGYYGNNDDGEWQPYRDFALQAAESTSPLAEMVDLTGDGRADIALLMQRELRYYQSLGTEGFAPAVNLREMEVLPPAGESSAEQFLGFADVFGDGLSHRICIRNGSVVCWPNLGYGRFGAAVELGNAPQIRGTFDSARLFIVDVDGSGTADIAYAYDDCVDVFVNCSGNSFAEPISIPLPAPFTNTSQITFADVTGSGASALVFTSAQARTRHTYYSFTEQGKPYLLTDINNNIGTLTRIQYASSMRFYFADKRAGNPWRTTLPFPVHVVERVESIDQVSKSKHVQRFAYHDGYYDPVEREFRGFGFAETWDTQTFEEFVQEGLLQGVAFVAGQEEQHVAAMYTKQWYHTGAFQTSGLISRQYAQEYWQGDPDACTLPDSSFSIAIVTGGGEQLRQAYVALAGQLLRSEVYAQDGTPVLSENPYTVDEVSAHVRLVQPAYGKRPAVFLVYARESVAAEYDRIADDPRTNQTFTLEVDAFGNVVQSCQVYYPRRIHPERRVYPDQQRIECIAEWKEVANVTEGYRQLGVPYQSRTFAVEGLTLNGQLYFSFAEIERQVQAALAPCETEELREQSVDEPTARLLTWERNYYWNEQQDAVLPLGSVSTRALLHHSETAVFSPELLAATFDDKVTDSMLIDNGGYAFADGYWWDRGLVQWYYTQPEQYYQAWKTENSYAPETSSLRTATTATYDTYYLAPVAVTEYLSAAEQNTVRVWIDYQTMQPWQLVDENDNVSQVQFDALGQVVVTTVYGWVDGVRMGNDDVATYVQRPDPTFQDVLARPEYYVQGMSDFFYYDAFAWMSEQQPICTISLVRQTYCSDVPPDEISLFQEHVMYFDGFGREIEKKSLVEEGEALAHTTAAELYSGGEHRAIRAVQERWIVSGRTVYNNKGEPVEQYAPYFSDTPYYEDQSNEHLLALLPPPTIMRYDPLLRVVRVDTPKGFFTRAVYTPWELWRYDEDDTVKDSRFYSEHMPDGNGISAEEKQALEQAATFYNTPSIEVLDTLGNAVLTIDNNLGYVAPDAFTAIVAGTSVTSQELWGELVVQGYLTADGWVAPKFWPYQEGFSLQLSPPFEQFAEPTLLLLKENCLAAYYRIDIEGREIEAIDPRLYYSNVAQQTQYFTIRYVYDMQGNVLRTDSADAGTTWSLNNIFANTIYTWNERGFCSNTQYDRFQRPVSVFVQGSNEQGVQVNQIVQRTEYGESTTDPNRYNLRGKVYKQYDQAGTETFVVYSIADSVLTEQRQLRVDYKTEANWNDPAVVPLEPEVYTTEQKYNALGDIVQQSTPDGSTMRAQYGVSGRLQHLAVEFADATSQVCIDSVDYTAFGERKTILYGNGVRTDNEFEFTTQRLLRIVSTRPEAQRKNIGNGTVLQHIDYTYDPVGNITSIRDSSYETVFCSQQVVEPLSTYTYDALYRLIQATGRQHPGIQKDTYRTGFKQSLFMPFCPVHPNDMDKLQQYTDYYTYDDSGNLTKLQHTVPPSSLSTSWTRTMNVADNSNRLVGEPNAQYRYDANGNAIELDNLRGLQWNWKNIFVQVDTIVRESGNNDTDYFVYNAEGKRIRKVAERYTNGESTVEIEEKIYLGTLEIKRQRRVSAKSSTTLLERQSLHVMDGDTRVAITSYWPVDTQGKERPTEPRVFRFQLDNNLGSSCMELTQNADIISYEEYFSYGGTSVIAGKSETEVQPKDYRYSGRECDDSTGLYYYGARYYASWIGRWINPDPAGTEDGLNLYAFVRGNPITFIDANGKGRLQPPRAARNKVVQKPYDKFLKVDTVKTKRKVSNGPSLGGLPRNSTIRNKILGGTRLMDRLAFKNARLANKYLVGIYYQHFNKVFAEDMRARIKGRGDKQLALLHFKSLYKDSVALTPQNKTGGTEITGEYATAKYMLNQQGYVLRLGYAKGTGIDQLWQKGNEYLVVEAKGEGASLSMSNHGMQMSKEWVEDRLIKLYNSADQDKKNLAIEIFNAADLSVNTSKRTLTSKGIKANPATIRGLVVEANWTPSGMLSATKQSVPNKGVYFN